MQQVHNFELLQQLRPDTVLGIENIDLRTKIQAIAPGAEVSFTITEVDALDPDDDELDVRHAMRIKPDTQDEIMVVLDRYVVAGGVVYDHDSAHCDPMEEGSANGRVVHHPNYRNSGGREEGYAYMEAIGRTSEGSMDLDLHPVRERLLANAMQRLRETPAVAARCRRWLKKQYGTDAPKLKDVITTIVEQGSCEDEVAHAFFKCSAWRLSEAELGVIEPIVKMLDEDAQIAAWKACDDNGEIGTWLAQPLDIYEHGAVAYSLAGGGTQCRWDTSRHAAMWIPCKDAELNIHDAVIRTLTGCSIHHDWNGKDRKIPYTLQGERAAPGRFGTPEAAALAQLHASGLDQDLWAQAVREAAARYCSDLLEEYSDWRNGWVYGTAVYVIDRQTGKRIEERDEEDWGMIGHRTAEEHLHDAVLGTVVSLVRPV